MPGPHIIRNGYSLLFLLTLMASSFVYFSAVAADASASTTKTGGGKAGTSRNSSRTPDISFTSPENDSTASGLLSITGTASDRKEIPKVEVKIGTDSYVPVALSGTTWKHSVDTKRYADGPLTLSARATNSSGSTAEAWLQVHVLNPIVAEPTVTPCSGVAVAPGQDIQKLVDQYPSGTGFCLLEGVHRQQVISPKDGQSFTGPATLDGEDVSNIAFRPTANNVTIRDLVIKRYANPAQIGAIHGGGTQGSMVVSCSASDRTADCVRGWVVENNIVHNNAGTGIRIGHGMIVRGNKVHHNRQLGVGGVGDYVVIEGNEISYNNYNWDYNAGWEAGGTKFARTHDLIVRGNNVHHNNGFGLWTDGSNMRTLYAKNVVADNTHVGIFHEVSYDAVIRNNTVSRNGFGFMRWVYGAGIMVAHSSNTEVYGNTVVDNWNGITGVQQERGSGFYGPFELRNLDVHDNVVTWNTEVVKDVNGHGGFSGVAQDVGDATLFDDRNVGFYRNAYRVPDTSKTYWTWPNRRHGWSGWNALKMDSEGTVTKS